MATVANLQVLVGADIKGALSGLERVNSAVTGMGSLFQTAAGTALGFTTALLGIRAIGAGMDALKGSVIGLNSTLEQQSIAFTSLLGSEVKAADMLAQLQKFANTTSFEFPQLAQAAQRMLATGFAAEQIIPMLTNVAGAAAAMGTGAAGVGRITTALTQMGAIGTVQMGELNQLSEANIPGLKLLATHLNAIGATAAGPDPAKMQASSDKIADMTAQLALARQQASEFNEKTRASTRLGNEQRQLKLTREIAQEQQKLAGLQTPAGPIDETTVRKMIENGQISAQTFYDAFAAYSQGRGFAQIIDAQQRTWEGATSTIQDVLGLGMAKAFLPLFEALRSAAVAIAAFVQTDQFASWVTTLQGHVQTAVTWLQTNLPAAITTMQAKWEALQPTLAATAAWITGTLIPAMGDLAGLVGPILAGAVDKLQGAWATLQPYLLEAAEQFGNLLNALRPLGEFLLANNIEGVLWGLTAAFTALLAPSVLGGAVAIIGPIAGAILGLFSPIVVIGALVGLLATAWIQNWGDIQGKVEEVWAAISPILDKMGEKAAGMSGLFAVVRNPLAAGQQAADALRQQWQAEALASPVTLGQIENGLALPGGLGQIGGPAGAPATVNQYYSFGGFTIQKTADAEEVLAIITQAEDGALATVGTEGLVGA